MALLERVSTLLRANLNELLDKAEDPQKLSKQILLDMENQLVQVKTQVAVALAEQHRLKKQHAEQEALRAKWRFNAELAAAKGEEAMIRPALERSLTHAQLADGFAQQHAAHVQDTETLRSAYVKLEAKLTETRARVELLLAEHRRNRALAEAGPRAPIAAAAEEAGRLSRLRRKVAATESSADGTRAALELAQGGSMEERYEALEKQQRLEELLRELKGKDPQLHA